MSSASNLEARARERKRRERIRKKRIRMCISITVMAVIAILIIAAIVTSVQKAMKNDTHTANPTPSPQTDLQNSATAVQQEKRTTVTASIGGAVTGSYVINDPDSPEKAAEELGIPVTTEENDLIQIIADANQKKHCYFTFEDGPSQVTLQILDVLRKYNIKATFFMTGDTIDQSADIARRVYEEGHLIANRVVLDDYDKLYADTNSFMTALEISENKIRGIMNSDDSFFRLVRFPGGTPEYSHSNDYKDIKEECIEELAKKGYYYCDWNTSNGDDSSTTKTAQKLYNTFVEYSRGYNNLIVLMHDSSSKETTAEGLEKMIEYLIENEYTFNRLDEIDYNPTVEDEAAE